MKTAQNKYIELKKDNKYYKKVFTWPHKYDSILNTKIKTGKKKIIIKT